MKTNITKLFINIIIQLLFLNIFNLIADDGEFYSDGGQLIPIEQTRISLKKEVLKMKLVNQDKKKFPNIGLKIDVYFEFENPGTDTTLLVGFVTPGRVSDEEESIINSKPFIDEFIVDVNNQRLSYKTTKINDKKFKKLRNNLKEYDDSYYVYYFNAKIHHGLNTIKHSYIFYGDYDNSARRFFYYRLKTGCQWANNEIEDLELQIDLGKNVLFSLPDSLDNSGKGVNWVKNGSIRSFKLKEFYGYEVYEYEDLIRKNRNYFYEADGYISFKAQHFKPTGDIDVRIYESKYSLAYSLAHQSDYSNLKTIFGPCFASCSDNYIDWEERDCVLSELSQQELRLLKNSIYALRNYAFKDKEILDFFNQFFWYIPDESVKLEDIKLTELEEELIKKINKLLIKK
jgi:hypothetical protein